MVGMGAVRLRPRTSPNVEGSRLDPPSYP